MKFCSACGHAVVLRVPDDGDHLPRHVCPACQTIHYLNPKIIVGVIPEAPDGRVLLCRRAIQPRLGFWTFPAGFMEMGETCAEGAAREALEESQAVVAVGGLLSVISAPDVHQVHLAFRGKMQGDTCGPTSESSEVLLMGEDEIPWREIAFPTIYFALRQFFADRAQGVQGTYTRDVTRQSWHQLYAPEHLPRLV